MKRERVKCGGFLWAVRRERVKCGSFLWVVRRERVKGGVGFCGLCGGKEVSVMELSLWSVNLETSK